MLSSTKSTTPGVISAVLLSLSIILFHPCHALLQPEYERCEVLLDRSGVMDACGHSMNPSAVAYLPSSRRLVVAGQEYLIHATDIGEGRFEVDGCYYGSSLSLGRGDLEGIASLDFALSKPEPADDPSGRVTNNWTKLKALEGHILAMEENYSYRGVYLVDTARLGVGLIRSENATISRFAIPEYLSNLEAVAFVPDLDDDDYLGVLIMGSQNRRIRACHIPLGDPSKPVSCGSRTASYSRSVDSMEYDPTFEVRPGVYGALVIGADLAEHAVYVDPWALALRGEVVRWSEEFEMRGGRVGGVRMTGREGHAIYGNTVFYALDEGKRASGAVACRMKNKPRCTVSPNSVSISGWHPTTAGDTTELTAWPPAAPSTSTILGVNGGEAVVTPPSTHTMDALDPLSELSVDDVLKRWPAYAFEGDGECGELCQREKDAMCMLYPELCIHLRCRDERAGRSSERSRTMEMCQQETALGSPKALEVAALTERFMIASWRQLSRGGPCGADCEGAKEQMCGEFPKLCHQLMCEDIRISQVPSKGHEMVACDGVSAVPEQQARRLLPIALTDSQMSTRWAAHHARNPERCDRDCQDDKRQMCLGNPATCWRLRCADIEAGYLYPVLNCDGSPPATSEAPYQLSSRAAAAAADGKCKWNGCDGKGEAEAGAWCASSLAKCINSCMGSWCPNTPGYQPVLAWEDWDSRTWNKRDNISTQSGRARAAPATDSAEEVTAPTRGSSGLSVPSAPSGYCNWSGCNGERQGTEWCRASLENCVNSCGGSWCWHSPAGKVVEIRATTPSPLAPSALELEDQPSGRDTKYAKELTAEAGQVGGSGAVKVGPNRTDSGPGATDVPAGLVIGSAPLVTLNADKMARWLGLGDPQYVGRLVRILNGIPNVHVVRSESEPAGSGED